MKHTTEAMATLKKKISYMKKAEEQYPREIAKGGKYFSWYLKLRENIAAEATALCSMYLLGPFKLRVNTPTEEFHELLSEEMRAVKKALKERDGDRLERVLNKSYSYNMSWIISHGGMGTVSGDVRKEAEEAAVKFAGTMSA